MNFFKKIAVPTGSTKELVAYESWTVRWKSRYDNYSYSTRTECEVFTSEEDANTFANALRAAFTLLRYKADNEVKVEQTKSL